MQWVKVQTLYDSEEKAQLTASIVATTEARLANQQRGSQYEVETKIEKVEGKWQVLWRKVFVGNKTGCGGGCESCCNKLPTKKNKGKVIPFRKPSTTEELRS
ncbi:hypothetical protein Dtox_1335 [Desulfofarcimen acetoxidans DSM 771]|uniref:Uncharacterized protein n=1 Tax=Desulfofarcimen acetoxidans (strain ATCC 49208 / DSM 771 / KCTC 5769 / VKM B-1644 / 5575) TaxID=485916 RepID=C8W6C3_DESAS|nr:hypothetical protein [Desulfofarcimen acetoxidans]ACV62212.1 hypothetical protein Dtox_1335 [Desulfofarcimen acetoxidans DSM 771]